MEQDASPTGLYNYLPSLSKTRKAGRRRKNLIGPVKEGLLKKVGYDVNTSQKTRRAAVKRAVKKYGRVSTIRKLNAAAVFSKRASPIKSRKFKKDIKIVQKMNGSGMFTDAIKNRGMAMLSSADPAMAQKLRNAATEFRSRVDPETIGKFKDLASHLRSKVDPETAAKVKDIASHLKGKALSM